MRCWRTSKLPGLTAVLLPTQLTLTMVLGIEALAPFVGMAPVAAAALEHLLWVKMSMNPLIKSGIKRTRRQVQTKIDNLTQRYRKESRERTKGSSPSP
ncbi:hypothetical protein HPB49_003758 [Dermacentor silvarum]|uniref:Uncharacterized protein n=1 Tax=Dermacentor silvarum TaxID=543639 RepID=A0ACB8DTP6_DERSI|nr:hypothetical protein HPB49_003758 [Dermacentor silvarum]